MLIRPLLPALLALSILVPRAPAAAPPVRQAASFSRLHAASPAPNMAVDGLELSLKDGQLLLKASSIQLDDETKLTGVSVRLPLDLGGDFFQAPVSQFMDDLLQQADVHVARFEARGTSLLTLTDMRMKIRQRTFEVSAKKIATGRAWGKLAWVPGELRLDIEVEGIRAGIVPIPRRVAFAVMKKVLRVPFVELASPHIYVGLAPFLR